MKKIKSIAVIYDSSQARRVAIGFCDGLVSRFWEQFEFSISWWSVQQLERHDCEMNAVKQAGVADMVVFATGFPQNVSPSLEQWIELWLRERGEHEGALVSLASARLPAEAEISPTSLYFRDLAHRAGMDYLTGVPEFLSDPIPESLECCSERAQQVTRVLDEILHWPCSPERVSLR